MQITNETERFNVLVAELDDATDYAFDRVTDISALAKLAGVWPGTRPDLADDLRAAHLSLLLHDAFRPLFDKFQLTT